MKVLPRSRKGSPSWEKLTWAKDAVATATAGYSPGGLRLDFARLDEDEQTDLLSLVEATAAGGGFNLARLGKKDRQRFEGLAEEAAGRKPGSVFQAARDLAEFRALGEEFARQGRAPARRLELAEEGSVTLSRQVAFDFVRDGVLFPSHVAMLVYLVACFENGAVPKPSAAVEFDGDAIRVDLRRGGGLLPDADGAFIDQGRLLDHLAANHFIDVEKAGKIVTIRRGSRLRSARRAA